MKHYLLLFCGLLLFPLLAYANFNVSPLVLEFNARPEEDQTKFIDLTNKSDKPLLLKVYQSDYIPENKGIEKELPPGSTRRSAAKWISISEKGSIKIPPLSSKRIQVSIQVPKKAKGIYWSKIFFEEDSNASLEANESHSITFLVKQRWEVRVYEEVPNTKIAKGDISSLQILSPQGTNPLSVELCFSNQGNALLSCTGELQVKNQKGEVVCVYPLGHEGFFLCYPSSNREFQTPILEALPKGTYTVSATIYYGSGRVLHKEAHFSLPRKSLQSFTAALTPPSL